VLRGATHVFGDGEDLCARVHGWLGIECKFLPSFRPLPLVASGIPPGPTREPRYLYLGRIHRAKGVFELATAFEQVCRDLPGATLHFVGDGPDLDGLRRAVANGGESYAIRCDGPVGRDAVAAALTGCDFVVIPTQSDSLPLVFSEAVQAGRPVIGTDVGDLGVFLRRYRVGLVSDSPRANDLARTMLEMAHAPQFDGEGRASLLKLLDPAAAAAAFCRHAFGAGSDGLCHIPRSARPSISESHPTLAT
jgi:glycosyltransferase involved in cell wall biosynthesis